MSTITPTAPPIAPAVATENSLPREERQQQLPVDRIVRAAVAEGGGERVVLELNHQRIQAETRVPLFTGQKLDLLVVATRPRIELQILADPLQQRLLHSLHLLGQPLDIAGLLKSLSAAGQPLITELSPEARASLDAWLTLQKIDPGSFKGAELHRMIRGLGLDLEPMLAAGGKEAAAALKGALLEILTRSKGKDGEVPEQAGRLLQQLELLQLCQVRLAEENIFLLPLPLPFLEQGFITIRSDQARKGDNSSAGQVRLTIHLRLRGLGNLEIDLLSESQGLRVRFACDSVATARFVSTFAEEIKTALSSFPLRGISFAGGAEDPAKALLAKILPSGTSALDTRV